MNKEELFDYLNNHVEEWSIDYAQKLRGVAKDILNDLGNSVLTEEEIERYLSEQEALFIERMESSIADIKAEIADIVENGGDQKESILSRISESFNVVYHQMVDGLKNLLRK